jgi:hypothetical protein
VNSALSRRWLRVLVLAICLMPVQALAQAYTASQVKGVLLFRIIHFAYLPKALAEQPSSTLCIIGNDPFGPLLDSLNAEQEDHFRIVRLVDPLSSELGQCALAYITAADGEQMRRFLGMLGKRPVLTISDRADFVDMGGMVGLVSADQHVNLHVNRVAAQKVGIGFSARLLGIAERVLQ